MKTFKQFVEGYDHLVPLPHASNDEKKSAREAMNSHRAAGKGKIEQIVHFKDVVATQKHVDKSIVAKKAAGHGKKNKESYQFVKHKGKYFLRDGHHRAAAAIARGEKSVVGHVEDTDK